MPVLPDVASRMMRSRVSAPDASPSRIIRAAARSFTDPPGFCHSAFAYSSTPGVSRSRRRSRTSGVRPIKSTTDEPALRSRTGQSGEEDIACYIRPNRSELYQKPFLLYSRGSMTATTSPQHQHGQSDPDMLVRLGGWLFKRRTWLPLPLALALLLLPSGEKRLPTLFLGIAIVALGEWLRLWAVHHIGVISRTRSDRLGPLVATGPFALMRNPLYLGNIALWVGFAVGARLLWLVPLLVVVLGLGYHAIIRWEEELLASPLGEGYLRE